MEVGLVQKMVIVCTMVEHRHSIQVQKLETVSEVSTRHEVDNYLVNRFNSFLGNLLQASTKDRVAQLKHMATTTALLQVLIDIPQDELQWLASFPGRSVFDRLATIPFPSQS